MSVENILHRIKGKVLDSENYERLKTAYEQQESQIARLKEENQALLLKTAQLQEQLVLSGSASPNANRFSEVETAILLNYVDADIIDLCSDDMIASLQYSPSQIETAIDELKRKEMIHLRAVEACGCCYELTTAGKKQLLEIESKDYTY